MINGARAAAAILSVALAISGCAVGRKIAYQNASPRLSVRGSAPVALAVQDQRDAVVTGAKRPIFVGVQRGGFGNPFDVTTASGQPLADDFAISIQHGLQRAGYRVIPVRLVGTAAPAQVQDAFRRAGAERGLLIQIHEWKSDTMLNVALHYGVIVRVLDAGGAEIARAQISGNDDLGGSAWDPAGVAEEAVPRIYNRKLEELLNNPAVLRALAPPAPPAPTPSLPVVAPPVESAAPVPPGLSS